MSKKAIILLSGGLDSTTCLAIAKSQGFDCYALSFSYGQKHASELVKAKEIAKKFHAVSHHIVTLPIAQYGDSSLTDDAILVEDYQPDRDTLPTSYVPARNTIFLSFALGYCEVIGAFDIFIGANAVDYSGYPDCRPAYLRAFETMANLATQVSVEQGKTFHIHAPLLEMTKADIIKAGLALGVDYSETVSCYRADDKGRACGNCDSCFYRKKGFLEAGLADPTQYYKSKTNT